MAIQQAVCNSFKQEILEGIHNFESVSADSSLLSSLCRQQLTYQQLQQFTQQLVKYQILVDNM
jgi:hypothetical protein